MTKQTKYYLFKPEELEGRKFIEADQLTPGMLVEPMRGLPIGAQMIVMRYEDTATKGEAPIVLESQRIPDPPKRGRPRKVAKKKEEEPTDLVI